LIEIKDRFLERERRLGGDETGNHRRRHISFIGLTRSSQLVPSAGQRGSDIAAAPTSLCPAETRLPWVADAPCRQWIDAKARTCSGPISPFGMSAPLWGYSQSICFIFMLSYRLIDTARGSGPRSDCCANTQSNCAHMTFV
jgi:hypothetical protein